MYPGLVGIRLFTDDNALPRSHEVTASANPGGRWNTRFTGERADALGEVVVGAGGQMQDGLFAVQAPPESTSTSSFLIRKA